MAIYPSYKYNVSLNNIPSNNNAPVIPSYQDMNNSVPMEYEQNADIGFDMNNFDNMNMIMNRDTGMYDMPNNSYFPVCRDVSQRLMKAMIGERDARMYYQKLMGMAPSSEDRNIISTFAEDEKKHYDNFHKLYVQLNRQQPTLPQPAAPRIPNYVEGLKKAIFDETDAYEFYRNTYMCINDKTAKEVFFEAMTDENEHAIRLNYLYTKNK